MAVAGIISEYNPFHRGHLFQIEEIRARLGAETGIVCLMSGNFVQRGEFAVLNKHSRAEAAVACGADLVMELPLPWAVASAERFGRGAVELLSAMGIVTHLAFGSESGETERLRRVARCLLSAEFPSALKSALEDGRSFAAARQAAVCRLIGADGELLSRPNDILAVEYLKAMEETGSALLPLAVFRRGAVHDGAGPEDGICSASLLRRWMQQGEAERMREYVPAPVWEIFLREKAAGRAPVQGGSCERAVLARLRSMSDAEFETLPGAGEGLWRRLRRFARTEPSLAAVADGCKTKRYAHSGIRRMLLCAYLGVTRETAAQPPSYLRVLAFSRRGQALLRQMKGKALLPVIIRPTEARRLPEPGRGLFELESRATDLYALAYPDLGEARGGAEWTAGPVRREPLDGKDI